MVEINGASTLQEDCKLIARMDYKYFDAEVANIDALKIVEFLKTKIPYATLMEVRKQL